MPSHNLMEKVYEPIRSERLFERIVEQIERQVALGNLKPGDRLPSERELCDQFSVSRTAVREAMKALTLQGLVSVLPGRGTFITDGTSMAVRHSVDLMIKLGEQESIIDLVEVREILEPEIAALAAIRASPEQLLMMQEAVEAMDQAMNDADTFIEADLDFHLSLAQATNNRLIPVLVDTLVDLLREHRKRAASVKGGLERGQPFHRRILQAVKEKKPEKARQEMQAHLRQVREDIALSLALEKTSGQLE